MGGSLVGNHIWNNAAAHKFRQHLRCITEQSDG